MEDGMFPAYVDIPTSSVAKRFIARVPIKAAIITGVFPAAGWIIFHSLWGLAVMVPVWLMMRWNAAKDPQFLEAWQGHLSFKPYYYA